MLLSGDDASPNKGCSENVNFLIESANLNVVDFIEAYIERTSATTGLNYLLTGQKAVVFGKADLAFAWLDFADRQVFRDFFQSGDLERAVFYAISISSVKVMSVQELCDTERYSCDEIKPFQLFGNAMGSQFSYLDDIRTDYVLYCALRYDSLEVPIREVLRSTTFNTCVLEG